MCIINFKGENMLPAVNSVKFASANNYKRTFTNTNQNTIGYQQSFGARHTRLGILAFIGALASISPANVAKAEDVAGKTADVAAKKAVGVVSTAAGSAKPLRISDLVKKLKGNILNDIKVSSGMSGMEYVDSAGNFAGYYGKVGDQVTVQLPIRKRAENWDQGPQVCRVTYVDNEGNDIAVALPTIENCVAEKIEGGAKWPH